MSCRVAGPAVGDKVTGRPRGFCDNGWMHARPSAGFTLIEVAIALIVVGLLITPLIQLYRVVRAQNVVIETDGNMIVIQAALQKFAIRNGHYPLPSAYGLGPDDSGYGAAYAGTPVPCTAGMDTVCRTTGARDVVAPAGNDPVLIGAVPFAALGLPVRYSRDAWGQKITYAVSESMTIAASFQDASGVIRIIDRLGGDTGGTSGNAHYALVSHGRNRAGAYTLYGRLAAPCPAAGADTANCDNDGVFTNNFDFIGTAPFIEYARLAVDVLGAQYYDDYVRHATTTTGDTWSRTANTPHIHSRNTENIRIGPGAVPQFKVQVMGDARAQQVDTDRLCEYGSCATPGPVAGLAVPAWPPRVFTPAIIGGTPNPLNARLAGGGISCGDMAMTGIGLADEECGANRFPAGYPLGAPCAPGTAARGTDAAGQLRCE